MPATAHISPKTPCNKKPIPRRMIPTIILIVRSLDPTFFSIYKLLQFIGITSWIFLSYGKLFFINPVGGHPSAMATDISIILASKEMRFNTGADMAISRKTLPGDQLNDCFSCVFSDISEAVYRHKGFCVGGEKTFHRGGKLLVC